MESESAVSAVYVFVIYVVALVVSIFFAVLAHELGHAVAGLMSGMRVVGLRLFRSLAVLRDGKWYFYWSNKLPLSGQTLLEPPRDPKRFRFTLMLLAGGMVNLLLSFISLTILLLTWENEYTSAAWIAFFLVNAFGGIVNLVPMSRIIPNDGMTLKEALRSSDARQALFCQMRMNSEMSQGHMLSDIDESLFETRNSPDISNIHILSLNGYYIGWLSEKDRSYDYTRDIGTILERISDKSVPNFAVDGLACQLMYGELLFHETHLRREKSMKGSLSKGISK